MYRIGMSSCNEHFTDALFADYKNANVQAIEISIGQKPEKDLDNFFKAGIGAYQKKAKKIAEDYNAVFIPLQDLFDTYREKTDIYKLLWDGVHPTVCGHGIIAEEWMRYCKELI